MIALSIDNQWTVEWHTWLPCKTNQFHVQHYFLLSSKRPVLVRAWPNSALSNFNHCRKVLSKKNILINIKTKNVRQIPCCVWSLLQYTYTCLLCLSLRGSATSHYRMVCLIQLIDELICFRLLVVVLLCYHHDPLVQP